jgi:adenine/guanine phosphoribosyltransferase-like PRPP-binding protein
MSTKLQPTHYTEPTTTYWQEIHPPSDREARSKPPWRYAYPALLPDSSTLLLPIRQLPPKPPLQTQPTNTTRGQAPAPLQAVASLIINQASLSVTESLSTHLAALLAPYAPDIIVALPTLGLSLAPLVAKELGHARYVPMGYSVKFWYDEELSVPVSSVTSPGVGAKRLYLDPNMISLLAGRGRRVALVDDAISSGKTVVAALGLLEKVGVEVVVVGVAMRQGTRWSGVMGSRAEKVVGVFDSPLLEGVEGGWVVRD